MPVGKTSKTYGTEADLVEALRTRHGDPRQWVFVPRLRVGAGFGQVIRWRDRTLAEQVPNPLDRVEQTIDAWAMDLWPAHNFRKFAYEVKVSRQDFFRELEHPEKREAAVMLSNYFFFVTPPGLVSVLEVPEDCGLLYVTSTRCYTAKAAPRHQGPEPTWAFISSVLRREVAPSDPGGADADPPPAGQVL